MWVMRDFGLVLVLNADRTVIDSSQMCRRPNGHGVPVTAPIITDTTNVFRFSDSCLILVRILEAGPLRATALGFRRVSGVPLGGLRKSQDGGAGETCGAVGSGCPLGFPRL
jgi:hypothetical protein